MRFSTLSSQRAALLVSILVSVPFKVCATAIERRADCCIGQCGDDDNGNQAPTLDGATSDRSPGIGVEFETGSIRFSSEKCTKPDTDGSKGKVVGNRQGDNWKLTADTIGDAGVLDAEYILDGTQIKLGTGKAAEAAAAVANDLTTWDPSAKMQDPHVDIQDSPCNPWTITQPEEGGGAGGIGWAPQVTAPLPLEAIHDLFSKAVGSQSSPLLSRINPGRGMVYVTKDFFQAKPNGISSDTVKDDVLGFFSLVVSYAKGAKDEEEDTSPKEIISLMPRTDWTNLFNQVKPAVPGTLYDIVKILACYSGSGSSLQIDTAYCSGTVDAPQPNGKMDQQAFKTTSNGKSDSCTVQEWIQSIADNQSPDRLSVVDQIIDGSIGGLKDALENVLDTNRAVPLFEFRRLQGVKAADMQSRVSSAESALVDYHKAFGNPPTKTKRSPRFAVSKRQDACGSPSSSPSPSSAPAPSAQLTCNGVDNTKWMGRDALNSVIPTFCADAENQGVQDPGSGSLVRSYNGGGPDAVTLSMDWPSGADFKPKATDCVGFMSTVMDSCDGNQPDSNPLNWKHGGYNQVGNVRYNVIPTAQRYKSGTCSIHVHEEDYFSGVDGPGTERTHTYYLRASAKDAAENSVAEVGNDVKAGDGNPLIIKGYYNDLALTPEAQGDYIQFTVGTQSWRSDKGDGTPRCNVGDWDADYSPVGRDMDCYFYC